MGLVVLIDVENHRSGTRILRFINSRPMLNYYLCWSFDEDASITVNKATRRIRKMQIGTLSLPVGVIAGGEPSEDCSALRRYLQSQTRGRW